MGLVLEGSDVHVHSIHECVCRAQAFMQSLEEYSRVTIVSLVFPRSLELNKEDNETAEQHKWDVRGFGRTISVLLLLVL
jgi:hypothetical protein